MSDEFNSNATRRGGFPGFVLGVGAVFFAGFLGIGGMVVNTFYQANKAMNVPEETVQRLAPQIVDRNVSALTLENEGYRKFKYGGFYLDPCREKVLTDSFNEGATVAAKADKINACIVQNIVETSAAANRGSSFRNR